MSAMSIQIAKVQKHMRKLCIFRYGLHISSLVSLKVRYSFIRPNYYFCRFIHHIEE
jgi:hypothetical protein